MAEATEAGEVTKQACRRAEKKFWAAATYSKVGGAYHGYKDAL